MYVYIKSQGGYDKASKQQLDDLWTVGFYHGAEWKWEAESDHKTTEEAADRVHWLNGGQRHAITLKQVGKLVSACLKAREWMNEKREPAEIVPAILDIDKAMHDIQEAPG